MWSKQEVRCYAIQRMILIIKLRTSEKMILQASLGQQFVHQKPIFTVQAVSNKFHQIRMMKLTKVIHFRLHQITSYKQPIKGVVPMRSKMIKKPTYQPLLVALKTLRFKPLDSHNHSRPGFWSRERFLINPSLINITKPAFSNKAVSTKIFCRGLELIEGEGIQPGWR